MRITLVQPKFKSLSGRQPPLGLAYLSAVLKQCGAKVSVIDANAEQISTDETVKRIVKSKPDTIGISATTPLINDATSMAQQIKLSIPDSTIILGGPHPTIMPEDVLKCGYVNIVVRGEAERTMEELYDFFNGKIALDSINGISYMKNGKVVHNPNRELIKNLDELPFPAWEYFPLNKYSGIVRKTDFNLPIMTSRGCPFGCIFCYKGIFGRSYRARSPKNVVDEIEYLVDNFKIKEFSIVDDNFTLNPKRAIEICDIIIKRDLIMPWCNPTGMRVETASLELFSKLKVAGCYRVYLAVESGDQKVIDFINKNITLEQARRAFEIAKKVGLETTAFFMIGNLNENEETMNKTIEFAKELDPDFVQFTIATPYPGTEMYERIKKDGKLFIERWDDLVLFKGAIFEYKDLNLKLINRMHKKAIKSFYFRPKFIVKFLMKIRSINDIKNLIHGGFTVINMTKKIEKETTII
jgi:radical SAM superfamily enzyme YgiQ (UPF0313 family)